VRIGRRILSWVPAFPSEQAVYAYVRDSLVTEALGASAERTA
jgi:hypothetical protein